MLPVIALVGRPNVGKSTLFNRLTRSRDALVADYSGLTRDRKYGEAVFDNKRFLLVDTGGLSGLDEESGIDKVMAHQSLLAIDEADEVLLLVDARAGLTPGDESIAKEIRQRGKQFRLVANKVDGVDEQLLAEFYGLGVGHVYPVSATHGRGVRLLIDDLPGLDAKEDATDKSSDKSIRIAIVGRPNVGKSTLVNRLLGEDRVVVFDHPGTTRDSIYIDYEREGQAYTLIDTAGVRRRKSINEAVEKFSILKTLQAISDAHVTILLIDAREGIVDQDLHMLSHVVNAGRALVIAVNKWDGLDDEHKSTCKNNLERKLVFNDFAEVHYISALHGSGVGKLYQSVGKAYAAATRELSTNKLTTILEKAVFNHPPPMINGRRIKLRYAHAGGRNPPIIVIHGNQTQSVPKHYVRYLEKQYRRELSLYGTPIKLEFRTTDNPYAGKKNTLSQRQINKKRRMMRHVKKKKR